MAVEIAAEVGHAPLGAVDIGQGLLKAQGAEHCPQWLAGLGRVDGEGLALEVEILVFLGGGPLEDLLDAPLGVALLDQALLGSQVVLVFLLAEKGVARLDVVDGLAHLGSPTAPLIRARRPSVNRFRRDATATTPSPLGERAGVRGKRRGYCKPLPSPPTPLRAGERGPESGAGANRRDRGDLILDPRRLHLAPAGIVDGHVHVPGEDGEAVVAVVGA